MREHTTRAIVRVMASDIPPHSPHSDVSDTRVLFDVSARVTFYSTSQSSTAKGKKTKKKATTKETRAKHFTFMFAPTKSNYLAFLQTILEKHHILQYTVSDQAVFPCNVQVPPSRCVILWPHCISSCLCAAQVNLTHPILSTLTNTRAWPPKSSRSSPLSPSLSLSKCPLLRRHLPKSR
jgi:hypothetical protein